MTGTILHLADVHLEAPFCTSGLAPTIGTRRRQELCAAFTRALTLAREQHVDAVTIAGDLYDGRYALPETGTFLADAFAALSPIPVIVAPGCADPYDDETSLYPLTRWPDNVTILSSTNSFTPVAVSPTLTVWGAAWRAEGPPELPQVAVTGDHRHLVLLHVGPAATGDASSGVPGVTPAALRAAGFSYALLGGRHAGGAWPEDDPWGCMPGSLEPLAPDEAPGRHGAALLRIAADGACSVDWLEVGCWRYAAVAVDLGACTTADEAVTQIEAALERGGVRADARAMVTVTVTCLPEDGLDLTDVRERVEARAHVTLRVERPFPYDLNQLAQEHTVRGLLVRRFRAASETGATNGAAPTDPALKRDALRLALRALDGKGVRPSEVA
ncbi:MAG TPA: hypothetical protein GX714_08340 [Chloroflexi bacterium]|nr:hypothetical protein [Chloroflexota bacterium]